MLHYIEFIKHQKNVMNYNKHCNQYNMAFKQNSMKDFFFDTIVLS